jgi:hypothetical protein
MSNRPCALGGPRAYRLPHLRGSDLRQRGSFPTILSLLLHHLIRRRTHARHPLRAWSGSGRNIGRLVPSPSPSRNGRSRNRRPGSRRHLLSGYRRNWYSGYGCLGAFPVSRSKFFSTPVGEIIPFNRAGWCFACAVANSLQCAPVFCFVRGDSLRCWYALCRAECTRPCARTLSNTCMHRTPPRHGRNPASTPSSGRHGEGMPEYVSRMPLEAVFRPAGCVWSGSR